MKFWGIICSQLILFIDGWRIGGELWLWCSFVLRQTAQQRSCCCQIHFFALLKLKSLKRVEGASNIKKFFGFIVMSIQIVKTENVSLIGSLAHRYYFLWLSSKQFASRTVQEGERRSFSLVAAFNHITRCSQIWFKGKFYSTSSQRRQSKIQVTLGQLRCRGIFFSGVWEEGWPFFFALTESFLNRLSPSYLSCYLCPNAGKRSVFSLYLFSYLQRLCVSSERACSSHVFVPVHCWRICVSGFTSSCIGYMCICTLVFSQH